MLDHEGKEVPGNRGYKYVSKIFSKQYNHLENITMLEQVFNQIISEITCFGFRYFGAAKELPGVRELFEQERE